jgi:hypothetical protein
MYALVTNGTVTDTRGNLPDSARNLETGDMVVGLRAYATVAEQQACGWFEVVDAVRPADTDTHTHDRTVVLVNGTPTVQWVQREWTADEQTARRLAEAPDLATVIAAKLVAQANETPAVWVPPTHAEDSVLPGQIVLHPETGDRWRNKHAGPNPWPLDERYEWEWLDKPAPPAGASPWLPWDGIRPLYQVDAEVTHKGRTWKSTTPNNHWEPGVFGWTDIGPA